MAEKYININTEELFQKYPINKIVNIQKEIQYEIDKKNQELRTMVGERYRDVIEASDTIKLMQESATNVLTGIEKIVDLCENMNSIKVELNCEDYDGTFDLEREKEQKIIEKSISMQIKILIYIPEQIWTAIDENNFLKATQLYLLAQHIYTGLKLDRTNTVSQNYPIIKTQWMKIAHFHKRIHNNLHNHLQNSTLSADIASNYLTAYALLENINIRMLLQKFIEFRKIILENELQINVRDTVAVSVKSITCSTLKLIINTIQLIYLCFIDDGGDANQGLIYQKLNNIVSKDAQPTINCVDFVFNDPLVKYLPKIVAEYKPIVIESTTTDLITSQTASECIQIWLDWVKQSINSNLSERLNMVTSIKGLDSIREEALKIKLGDNWEQLCRQLLLERNFNVWFLIFQPLITERVIKLIQIKWNQIVDETLNEMLDALINASSGKTAKPEIDLRWFTWKEEKTDVPFKFNVDGENKFIAKGLLMKSKGYSPNVLKLCEDFDGRLGMLLTDLDVYLFGKEHIKTERASVRVDNFLNRISQQQQQQQGCGKVRWIAGSGLSSNEKFSDKHEIQEHLQQISRQQMERLIGDILSKSQNKSLSENEVLSYNLMIARFLLAIQQLSPNLLKCFKRDVVGLSARSNITAPNSSNSINQWNNFCQYLLEQRLQTWNKWLDVMDTRLSKIIEDSLRPCVQANPSIMLEFYPQWCRIEIEENGNEEEDVDNEMHKSIIYIPSQINLYLQNLLFKICCKLNGIIPHTLPKQIHLQLIDTIMFNIFKLIKQIINNTTTNNNNNKSLYLQLLFDIKYLNIMFVSQQSDNQSLHSCIKQLLQQLQQLIDPFDYDVFYPHIQQAVFVSAQKTQCILGILINKPESLATVLTNQMKINQHHQIAPQDAKDAMILPISNCTNVWFPLLPVTAPLISRSNKNSTTQQNNSIQVNKNTNKVEKKKVIKSSPKHSKSTDNNSTAGNLVRSGAASFLSDWFG